MGRLIFALLLFAAAIYLISKGKLVRRAATPDRRGYPGEPEVAYPIRWVGFVLLFFGALLVLWSMLYKLDVGEAAVIKPISGNVTKSDVTAGFGTKAPWESVIKFDVRNQNINFFGTNVPSEQFAEGQINDIRISANTDDNADVYIDMSIQYSLDPGKVLSIYKEYRTNDNFRSRAILPGTRGAVQIPPTEYITSDIRQQRPELTTKMKQALETQLSSTGFRVDSISIRNMSFTEDVQKSLNRVQAQKGETNSAREQLNTSLINAEKVRVDAQAQSDADQIARCGATTTTKTVKINGLDTQQTTVTPIPAAQCQSRLNEQVLTSKYIDMLREAAAKGNTVYVVPQGANNLLQLGQTK